MRENLEAARLLTKEEIKRTATLSLHTYAGATADEWQEQVEALREGVGGERQENEDARLSEMIADALHELDEECAGKFTSEQEVRIVLRPESNTQLARLWVALSDVRDKIDNEVIPLGTHLGLEDTELMQALETLSDRTGNHFARWRLIAETRKESSHRA